MNREIKKPLIKLNFLAVTVIEQQIKLVLVILCVNEFNLLVQVLLLHGFIYSISCLRQITQQYIITSFNKKSKDYKGLLFV